jgi:hypothetical protein
MLLPVHALRCAEKEKDPIMRITTSLLGSAALGLLITGLGSTAQAQSAGDQSSAQASTEAEVRDLRERLRRLEERMASQPQAAPAVTPSGAVAGPDKLAYKGITLTLGGFAAAESVYRSANETADIGSSFSAIPLPNSALGHTSELRLTARQSRLSALMQGRVSDTTQAAMYGEFDFLGAAQTANSNESNSYTPRIRNLYGSVDWDSTGLHLLAGQNWSLVTMNTMGITPRNEAAPLVIEAQYVPGFSWTRQPQIRLTKDFDKTLWLAVSIENPQTTFYTGANPLPASLHLLSNATAGSGFNSANSLSLNHIPDVVGKIAYEPVVSGRALHLEAFGLYRSFFDRYGYENHDVSGGGFGAGAVFAIVPKILELRISGMSGRGIGRYGSAQLPDVTFNPNGEIAPIKEKMGLVGLTLHAMPTLEVYAYAGIEKDDQQGFTLGGVQYGYGNPLYDNSACFSELIKGTCVGNTKQIEQETIGFWERFYQGNYGRLQFGIQYSRTERKVFDGVGGAPSGDEDMIFTSFRYYPF